VRSPILSAYTSIREWLPEGRSLPDDVWRDRHRGITTLAIVQAVALFFFGLSRGFGALHSLGEASLVFAPSLLAIDSSRSRTTRAIGSTTSLMLGAAVLVHMAGGVTEAHFLFFVMIGVVALYQEWKPYLVGIAVVLLHHGIMGTLDPAGVFGTPAAQASPWKWALIHAVFVLAASITSILAWRMNEQQSLQDTLTGVGNRTRFGEALERRLSDPGQSVTVLFVDIDNFKAINNTRGHYVGDEVLRAVAQRLSSCARRGDVVTRLSGDEFAVLVHGDTSAAEAVVSRFERELTKPVVVDGHSLTVRASIGVADTHTTKGREAAGLVRNASMAMVQAKAQGNARRIVFGDQLSGEIRERARLQTDLATALEHDEFSLVYQPLIDLFNGSVVGCEALLRWHHPDLGMVPPDVFIPLAEETSLIVALGEWVLRGALNDLDAVRSIPGFKVSVNLSPQQLLDPGRVGTVADALRISGWPADRLVIEITETVVITDLARSTARLSELRDLGVKIAIDDFGTGYSSLSYLRELPNDIVKIDRVFIASLAEDPRSATLLQAIITMAQGLGLSVIAEGVEDQPQADALRSLNCRVAQGYLFARPMPIAELTSFTRSALDTIATD
jgi:diguanylate cyclase (GGDEF)-like protein